MKIFLITPIYATTTEGDGATPVVHYFAKEWAKQGHEVHVINLRARFPHIFYWFSKKFQHRLNSRLGMLVPTKCPQKEDYTVEGVKIHRRLMRKIIPHSTYSHYEITKAIDYITKICNQYGIPDVFIGHWHNPQLEVLSELKKKYRVKNVLVLHENEFSMEKFYGNKLVIMLKNIDVIGFRNPSAKADYISHYGEPNSSFIAYSGVSTDFLAKGKDVYPDFKNGVKNFIFVGSLIARKHPVEVVKALDSVYNNLPYCITYVGDGAERSNIENSVTSASKCSILFTGRIQRNEVMKHLMQSQVFIMISKGEIFGLVYLEAMAFGLIPIGSRHEGIDGIITDGINGFLCEAGNEKELSAIIRKIKSMSTEELEKMSAKAKETAQDYSDSGVAKKYLESI